MLKSWQGVNGSKKVENPWFRFKRFQLRYRSQRLGSQFSRFGSTSYIQTTPFNDLVVWFSPTKLIGSAPSASSSTTFFVARRKMWRNKKYTMQRGNKGDRKKQCKRVAKVFTKSSRNSCARKRARSSERIFYNISGNIYVPPPAFR